MLAVSTLNNEDSSLSEANQKASEFSYSIADTGQTECYNSSGSVNDCPDEGEDFYGQDAQFGETTFSFTDNDDGTVTDNVTGLIWQKVPSSEDYSWQEAVDYANEAEIGGYDDWRLPSLKELFSISDFSEGWPYIDTEYFSLASGEITKDEQYWSNNAYVGTTAEGGSNAAFGVNHVTGHIKAYPAGMPEGGEESGSALLSDENTPPPPPGGEGGPSSGLSPVDKYVRLVRGNEYGVNEYVDNGDGTVSDQATGLMWMQADSGDTMNWETALEYAAGSELAGYSDWRLPNIKELQSLADYSKSPTASEAENIGAAVDDLFSCSEMTNEAGASDFGYYWSNTSARFNSDGDFYYAWYLACGMAVNDEGDDFHGAGAVRFDTKEEDGPASEDAERYYNFVRLVRNI